MPTPVDWFPGIEFDESEPRYVFPGFQVIGLSNGNILVAYATDDDTAGPSTGRDIIGRIYDAEANLIRDWFQINEARTTDDEEDFSIAATNDGGFVIAYIDNDIGNPDASALIWQRHLPNGAMVNSATIDAESTADGQFLNPSVAVNQLTNETVIAFQETIPGIFTAPPRNDIYFVTVDATLGTVSAQFNAADNSSGDETDPQVAILSNGNIVTVYLEDSTGSPRTEFRVTEPDGTVIRTRTVGSGAHAGPSVAALANGNFVVAFADDPAITGTNGRVGYQIFFPTGISATVEQAPLAPGAFFVRTTDTQLVALPDGGFVLGWAQTSDGQFVRFDANGNADGSMFRPFDPDGLVPSLGVTSDGRILYAEPWFISNQGQLSILDPRDGVINASDFELGLPNFTETDVITALPTSSTLIGDADANTLLGQGGNDLLQGFGGDDTLIGGAGQDRLEGGTGADTMIGGPDNDSFVIDSLNDAVVELPDEGFDFIFTQINLQLSPAQYPNVEVFFLTDSATQLEGSDDNDQFFANFNLDSVLIGNGGDDRLNGRNGNDTLVGGEGNDLLDGGPGDDDLAGGLGNDQYAIDSVLDLVTELPGEGVDSLTTSINLNPFGDRYENIEVFFLVGDARAIHTTNNGETILANADIASKLFAYGGDDTLIGGIGNDKLYGGLGDDILNGGEGRDRLDGGGDADAMAGGAGDDRYFVDNLGDTVTELADEGTDLVKSTVDWTLGDHLENLRLGPSAAEGIGNDLDNAIFATGQATLRGNGGNDTMRGSNFDDQLFGNDGNDNINGRAGNDTINGGRGDDFIKGRAGEDTINGGSGNDVIIGGKDNDWISGGSDQDELKGEGGADTFAFADGDFAGLTDVTADRITDFSQSDGDVIDLSAVDAITGGGDDAFTFIADAAFSGTAGELRFEQTGSNTMVFMDVDGDGVADYAIRLDGTINLAEADFVL